MGKRKKIWVCESLNNIENILKVSINRKSKHQRGFFYFTSDFPILTGTWEIRKVCLPVYYKTFSHMFFSNFKNLKNRLFKSSIGDSFLYFFKSALLLKVVCYGVFLARGNAELSVKNHSKLETCFSNSTI